MNITEKSAYLKGLADGLELDTTKAEGKIINALLDLVAEMAEKLTDLDDEVATLGDYIEEIDEDLGNVEECVYDDECDCCDDDDCYDCDDEDCDCCCGDEDFREALCPNCNETVCYESSIEPEDLSCPACKKPFVTEETEA